MAADPDAATGRGYRECRAAYGALLSSNPALAKQKALPAFMARLWHAKALPGRFPREDPRSQGRLATSDEVEGTAFDSTRPAFEAPRPATVDGAPRVRAKHRSMMLF